MEQRQNAERPELPGPEDEQPALGVLADTFPRVGVIARVYAIFHRQVALL
jgi:hypothetical protein